MFQQKKMFKILAPIEKPNGAKWWMKCGSGFENKDSSINMYLDALPLGQKGPLTLQLREVTEEEMRERSEKRATYSARGTVGGFDGAPLDAARAPLMPHIPHAATVASGADQGPPF